MKPNDFTFGIIGLGQIGGSIASAMRKTKPEIVIHAFDIRTELLKKGMQKGIISHIAENYSDLITHSDIVVIALPISGIMQLITKYSAELKKKVLVTDTGSLKADIITTAEELGYVNFIGGHPLAGSEKQGATAWDADLFSEKNYFYSFAKTTSAFVRQAFLSLLESIRAVPIEVNPIEHDRMFALTSNLPHLFAFLLKRMYDEEKTGDTPKELFSCTSFYGATRIAESDPEMVHQMLWHNRKHLQPILKKKVQQLAIAYSLIEQENEEGFRELFKL